MRDFDIQQVIPATGWRWCLVTLSPDEEIEFEVASVGGFALVRERDTVPDEPATVVPLVQDADDIARLVPLACRPDWLGDAGGFLVDPLAPDAQIYERIVAAAEEIRSRRERRGGAAGVTYGERMIARALRGQR